MPSFVAYDSIALSIFSLKIDIDAVRKQIQRGDTVSPIYGY